MAHTPGWKDRTKQWLKLGRRSSRGGAHRATKEYFDCCLRRLKKKLQVETQGTKSSRHRQMWSYLVVF
jgi:hypothetical protein